MYQHVSQNFRMRLFILLPDRDPVTYKLPTTATAPFCPSATSDSIVIPPNASLLRKMMLFVGPGLLISIGYMDPGNWATAIEAGSRFGYSLLFVVVLASLSGMVLQNLCSRLASPPGGIWRNCPPATTAVTWQKGSGCWQNCRSLPPIWLKCWVRRWRFTCCWECRSPPGWR